MEDTEEVQRALQGAMGRRRREGGEDGVRGGGGHGGGKQGQQAVLQHAAPQLRANRRQPRT